MGLLWKRGYLVATDDEKCPEIGVYPDRKTAELISLLAYLSPFRHTHVEPVQIRRWKRYGITCRNVS